MVCWGTDLIYKESICKNIPNSQYSRAQIPQFLKRNICNVSPIFVILDLLSQPCERKSTYKEIEKMKLNSKFSNRIVLVHFWPSLQSRTSLVCKVSQFTRHCPVGCSIYISIDSCKLQAGECCGKVF